MDDLLKQSSMIKAEARRLGFDGCGISRAEFLAYDAGRLKDWLDNCFQGGMDYMKNHADKRVDPRMLVPGAKSVISVILNYYPAKSQKDPESPVLSKYAYGEDYHQVIRNRLKRLLRFIQETLTPVNGRAFVDSAPVLDRAWAARAGLGWIGKNTCLITPESGSFFFIGSLIVDIPLYYDKAIQDFCGDCARCIRACPTQAIVSSRILDARRCISYLTIENKQEINRDFRDKFSNRVFGCDICQDVCPWNRKAVPHDVKEFDPLPGLLEMTRREWYEMDEEAFQMRFAASAIKRAKYEGLRRNLEFIE
jgi:epoxyqueuosine reductase